MRVVLGKERRNKLFTERKLIFNYELFIIPTLIVIKLVYLVIKHFRLGNSLLFKITVPKYNYKAYCPANKDDLLDLTIREDEIIERFCPKEGEIVVDVGAHFGRYTIIASKRVGDSGKVISIEPDPGNFELLNKNIKLNSLTNVTTLNYAAYSEEAKIKMHLRQNIDAAALYNTVMENRFKTGKFIEIKANTLDNLLQLKQINLNLISWIKIDVEGAELEVLKGAASILSQGHSTSLLIEIHRLGTITLYDPIREFLESYNFKIVFEMIHDSGERHIIAQKLQQENLEKV